jgi:hypothetical protein
MYVLDMAVEQALPPDLGSLTPGAELGAVLDGLDLATVPDGQVVEVLQASWRQISRLHALYYAAMVEVGRREPADEQTALAPEWRALGSWQWSTSQIGAALTFTQRRTDVEYGFAVQLLQKLPRVWAALHAGEIDPPKARLFGTYLGELTDPQIERICCRVLPKASGWTTGQLAARLLREVLAIDPGFTRRRYQKAVRERGVWGYIAGDGSAVLSAHGLSPAEAAAAAERLELLAAAIRAAGHPLTEDQLRADLFVRLLDGRYTGFTSDQITAAMLAEAAAGATECTRGTGGETAESEPAGAEPAHSMRADAESADAGLADAGLADAGLADAGLADAESAEPVDVAAHVAGAAPVDGAESENVVADTGPTAPVAPPEGARSGIEVRIGLATLLGLDDHPAELAGWGPINADVARPLVERQHAAEWRFAVVDDHGYLLFGGLTRHRPSGPARSGTGGRCRGGVVEIHIRAGLLTDLSRCPDLPTGWGPLVADLARQFADRRTSLKKLDGEPRARFPSAGLRRYVQMRDRHCVAPGCRRPARKSDQDHTREHARGGDTVKENLDPLCLGHHVMKHDGGWTLTQPEPGRFRWRSPLGQVYRTRGDPIGPDLPEPVPGSQADDGDAPSGPPRQPRPIFDASEWRKLRPSDPSPPDPPRERNDDPPPF